MNLLATAGIINYVLKSEKKIQFLFYVIYVFINISTSSLLRIKKERIVKATGKKFPHKFGND